MLKLASSAIDDSGIAHGFFGRRGGVSEGIYTSLNCGPGSGDNRDAVLENRRRAVAKLAPESRLVTLYQIHSADARIVTTPWEIADNPKADGMATRTPGIVLGILTADCAPVLMCDPEAGVIGAGHAGWQGALGGITDSVIAAMEELGARRSRIRAAVGPCIGPRAYEVGPEFRDRFVAADAANSRFFERHDKTGNWHFDLPAYVAKRLARAAVAKIDVLARCTYFEEANFFSFRRTTHRKERDYGRQLSAIALKN